MPDGIVIGQGPPKMEDDADRVKTAAQYEQDQGARRKGCGERIECGDAGPPLTEIKNIGRCPRRMRKSGPSTSIQPGPGGDLGGDF